MNMMKEKQDKCDHEWVMLLHLNNDKIDWQCKKCGKIDWDNEYIHN